MRLFFLLAALVMASAAAPASAQQPAPQPEPPVEDILDEILPEAEADADIKRMGQEATKARACKRLLDATQGGSLDPEDGPVAQQRLDRLRDAVRYYARAHGLSTTDVDALIDELGIREGVSTREPAPDETDEQYERRKALEAQKHQADVKRWGKCYEFFWSAVARLRGYKAYKSRYGLDAPPPPPPPTPVSSGPTRTEGGLSRNAKVGIGAGVVLVAGVAVLSGGSDSGNSPPTTNVSGLYGNYPSTLTIGTSSVSGCGRTETSQIPVVLSGNPDGSGFVLNKGGLRFTGVMRANGSFEVAFAGPISGLANLPNGTVVNWTIGGTVTGTQLSATGRATVTSGNCNGAILPSTLAGARN